MAHPPRESGLGQSEIVARSTEVLQTEGLMFKLKGSHIIYLCILYLIALTPREVFSASFKSAGRAQKHEIQQRKLLELTMTDVFALKSWNSSMLSVLGFRLGMKRSEVATTAAREGLRLSESKPPNERPCESNRCDVESRRGIYIGISLEFDSHASISQIDVEAIPSDAAPAVRRAAITKKFKGNTYEFFNHYSEALRSKLLGPGILVRKEVDSPPKVPVMDVVYSYPEHGLRIYASINMASPQAPMDNGLTVSFVPQAGAAP